MLKYLGVDEEGVDVRIYVKEFKEKLLAQSKDLVHSIVVFGSRVRGNWKPWSDIDVMIVLRNIPPERKLEVVPYAPLVQPWIYTEKEFYECLKKFDIAILDALEYGLVIYDDGFWKKAKKYFEQFKKEWELVPIEDGWISKRIEREALRRRRRKG